MNGEYYVDHWSSPSGCHPDCPACAEEDSKVDKHYYITELNDGIQWLTDGHDFGMRVDAAPAMLAALEEITKREGRYNRDPLKFAENTIDDMEDIATKAIEEATG